jgi:enterochelin esterase-like enzyme
MVDVYFPPGYDENPDWSYPVIYYLHGYGGDQNSMGSMLSWLTSLINNGTIDPVIMVGADNSPTPLGGSGYVNSILWGNYEDYMVNDLIQWIDSSFRTLPYRDARALLGQSMGGFGAFRYGILHKDKFSVLASHAGVINLNDAYFREQMQQSVLSENAPGPPYFYDFYSSGIKTKLYFVACAITSPDTNSPQTYINPQIVQFLMDEDGNYFDSILAKQEPYDIIYLIDSLSITDDVGIFFGCGTNDAFFLYPGHLALKDTLDSLGLPYEFYSHDGNHAMPGAFKERAFTFLDSLLMPPGLYTQIDLKSLNNKEIRISNFPNPFTNSTTIQFELSKSEDIELRIYDHLGQQIKTLFKGTANAGILQTIFDASSLSTGIYFCRLQIGNETLTKKIIKVK